MNAYSRSNLNPNSRATAKIRHGFAVLTLLFVAAIQPGGLQAQTCSGQSPAFPVIDDLWLPGIFRPGLSELPADQIPAERDSTGWDSIGLPACFSGHEIFESLDIAGDYLYVAYNVGFSVWNIAGANAEDPVRVAVRDGVSCASGLCQPNCGSFLAFPGLGETDFLIFDVAVLPIGTNHYIALSGYNGLGMSLWQHNTATGALTQIYQNTTRISRQVRIVEVGGTIYAFSSSSDGVAVYDVDRALEIDPCLETTGLNCPGVYLGDLGSITAGHYLDIMQRPTGELLVAVSDGDTTGSGQGLELWEVANPASPGTANQLFSGLDDKTFGTALFSYEGNDYLAALERVGSFNVIEIFNINACRGGCSLGAPVFGLAVPPRISNQFLTFSTSNGTPFLYYGFFATNPRGPKIEQLLDLTTLGRPGQNITELTTGSPTYFDMCQMTNVDYWGWYYPGNDFGPKNLTPQIGKFDPDSNFFYRAARGVLDVHVWEAGINPPDPEITTTVSNPDPQGLYWMEDDITFEGAGSNGCDPQGIWTWTPITPAEVNAVTVSEVGNQVTLRFECNNGGARCDDAIVSVSGANSDPSCNGADLIPATITVKDPALEIESITPAGGLFTQCTIVTFDAELLGRGPVDFAWNVNGAEAEAGVVAQEDLSTSMLSFDWDTATVTFGHIFSDGFESGDTSAWSLTFPEPRGTLPVTIELSLDGGNTADSVSVDLTPLTGDPEFGEPPIMSSTMDSSTFDFHANTVLGTVSDWSWELEDDDGGSLCTFGPDTNVPCVLESGQDISHTWIQQAGPRRVDLTIGNCQTMDTVEASTTVTVASVEPLDVTTFELDRVQSQALACDIDFDCINTLVCTCYRNETIFFEVEAEGDPDVYDFDWDGDGTFEDTDNPVTGTEYTHVYPLAIGLTMPEVRARRGAAAPAQKDLRETLDIVTQ